MSWARAVGAAILFSAVMSACCCGRPRDTLDKAPDHECSTGSTHGYDIAIWDCTENARVVAYRTSGELSCGDISVERSTCGTPTPLEKSLDEQQRKDCEGAVLIPVQ